MVDEVSISDRFLKVVKIKSDSFLQAVRILGRIRFDLINAKLIL